MISKAAAPKANDFRAAERNREAARLFCTAAATGYALTQLGWAHSFRDELLVERYTQVLSRGLSALEEKYKRGMGIFSENRAKSLLKEIQDKTKNLNKLKMRSSSSLSLCSTYGMLGGFILIVVGSQLGTLLSHDKKLEAIFLQGENITFASLALFVSSTIPWAFLTSRGPKNFVVKQVTLISLGLLAHLSALGMGVGAAESFPQNA